MHLKDKYPFYTTYQYAGNKPVSFIDLDGLEPVPKDDPKYKILQEMKSPFPFSKTKQPSFSPRETRSPEQIKKDEGGKLLMEYNKTKAREEAKKLGYDYDEQQRKFKEADKIIMGYRNYPVSEAPLGDANWIIDIAITGVPRLVGIGMKMTQGATNLFTRESYKRLWQKFF